MAIEMHYQENECNVISESDSESDSVNIWVASSDGNLAVVKDLVENQGISVNEKDESGYSPLAAAVSYNYFNVVEYLLEKGADINVVDIDGESALFRCETVEMAQYLLDHGINAGLRNYNGQLASDVLEEDGNEEVADLIRSHLII